LVKKSLPKSAKKSLKDKPTHKAKASAVESLLKSGDLAPPFSVQNEKGEVVSLKSLLGKRVVLYFYPKDDTPGCTQEGCDFRDNFARVKKAGVQVYGVSRDSVKSHEKFKAKYGFPFSLLSDEDGKLTENYGVWKEKNLYGRKYMGVERTTFLIGEDGLILKVYPKVKVKGHVDQVLEDLK
jgi:peroxiredoxin Q/BCP